MWQQVDLVVEQNADYADAYYFYDDDAAQDYATMGGDSNLVPHNFTGATLKMQVRATAQATSTLLDTYSTGTGEIVLAGNGVQNFPSANPPAAPAYNNGFTLNITNGRTAALPSGIYYYDILYTTAGGVQDYIMGGKFEVVARQTR